MKKSSVPTLSVMLVGVVFIGVSAMTTPAPRLVWNASASTPIGLYRVLPDAPECGDLVLIRPPQSTAEFAAERGYLPAGVPLIKRVVAMAADDVCAFDGTVFVNGKSAAHQRETDRAGRPMPRWKGCRELIAGEFFLMNAPEDSFDSRYFGPVMRAQIIGRIAPIWTE